ncbi:dihydrodipicolinate synthase family protein [Wenjunlia tyrosinilytica]|uniref:Dihydrodipicolinate synthase family protein n=1 Tax=Wenjunlia tyrosinilytica TaxID=1544741 RepID=A0A918DYF1_9ACTN|nr:dihydrodipicolinate synthase family protein [Wenjunlia tyrosinilytica]GGO91841.1 dihydrodipicolinate synthase family protein [Wenjunlia tyrosinilytica]
MSRSAALARGVWGVLATPFHGPDLRVDRTSVERLVRLYHDCGATGLTALGVFGEAASLTPAERREVLSAVAAARGALPVVAGLTALATRPAAEQAAEAVAALGGGCAGVMVQVNTADGDALARHLGAVHDACGAGVVVQDYPLHSGVRIDRTTLGEVVANCPFVVGVKAEAAPTAPAVAALAKHTRVPVFGGLGGVGLLDELAAGAAGVMTGFSFPEALVATVGAWHTGGFPAARATLAPWLPLVNFEAVPGIGLAVRKELLQRRGVIAEAGVRLPAPPLPAGMAASAAAHLAAVESMAGL